MKILKINADEYFLCIAIFHTQLNEKPLLHHICNWCICKAFLHYSQKMRLIATVLPSYYLLGVWGHFNLGVGFSEIPLCECYHSGNMLTRTYQWITAKKIGLIQEICYTRKGSIYYYDMLSLVLLHKTGCKAKHYGKLAYDITHELSQTIIAI